MTLMSKLVTALFSAALLAVLPAAPTSGGACQDYDAPQEPPRIGDPAFLPAIDAPAFAQGEGPVVLFDEGHNNFHLADGTYSPFVKLLERDGYVVKRNDSVFDAEALAGCDILVIVDAMPRDVDDPYSTFSRDEIAALVDWVHGGGALFLITDHMPDPFAVEKLARAFGIIVLDGYVLNGLPEREERPMVFDRKSGTLADHAVTRGRGDSERIESVATFTGCAFRGKDLEPLLVFGKGRESWSPDEYWQFPPGTATVDVAGWYQGAVAEFGEGRIAFFGEAAMFTAQLFGDQRIPAGMNLPVAEENARFLLNVLHWLSGIL
jgi:hypothetical protein